MNKTVSARRALSGVGGGDERRRPLGIVEPPVGGGPGRRLLVARAVAALALASTRRPLLTVAISLLLAAAGTLYTLHSLTFVTSNVRLLPQKASYVVRLKDYQRDFGELNDIVAVVEAASPDRSKAYAARLVAELERQGLGRSRITYRVDPAYFEGRGLLYLSHEELIKLRDRLFDYQEFIESYAARPTLPQLLAGLNQQIANSMALGFFDVGLRLGRRDRPPVPRVGDRPDLGAARWQDHLHLAVVHRLLGGALRRPRRRLFLLRRPAGCSCSCSSSERRGISRTAAASSRPFAGPSPGCGPTSRT